MEPTGKTLIIDYLGEQLSLAIFTSGKTIVYLANFTKKAPLFLTKTKHKDLSEFWTSVPEGRLAEATEIGSLIDIKLEIPKQSNLF